MSFDLDKTYEENLRQFLTECADIDAEMARILEENIVLLEAISVENLDPATRMPFARSTMSSLLELGGEA